MSKILIHSPVSSRLILGGVMSAMLATVPGLVLAQNALEEIVVTAQRRNESMQDVPISLEAVSGNDIQRQGYRALDELALFTPTVIVEPEHLRPSMSVRGLGAATTDAFSVEQSTPIFLDGVHYARTSMIKLSFLDVQQVEILKGPQPVYFGQNAIAGAFNITTRKPTPEWEGYVDGSYASFGTESVEAAIGGPVNDTFGIRVAGKYEKADGYLRNVVDDAKFPNYKNLAGRIMAQWTPNEKFKAIAKFDMADLNKGAEGIALCYLPGVTLPEKSGNPLEFNTTSVWLDPPLGVADKTGVAFNPLRACDDIKNEGRSSNGPFFAPDGSYLENGNRNAIDIRAAGNQLLQDLFGVNMDEGFEKLTPWSTYLDLNYEMDNGIVLSSLSSYDQFERETNRENRYGLMIANIQYRDHNFRSMSQELRASSAVGGDWNWMVGGYVQDIAEDSVLVGVRGNTDQAIRTKFFDADGNWQSAFANVSYDALMDGKMSVSVGARYSHVKKTTRIWGYYDTWIMADPITGAPTVLPYACRPSTGCPGYNKLSGYWQGATAVGYTTTHLPTNQASGSAFAPAWDNIDQPEGVYAGNELNPQFVLSYRPNDDHTLYAKYAESFKAGGADGSLATFPSVRTPGDPPVKPGAPSNTSFEFKPEYAFHYEIGAKGKLLDGRMRYDISAYQTQIEDLQIGTTQALSNNSFISFGNAGEQKVKGLEFAVDFAATDRLTLGLGGSLMDNVMVDFMSTCTEVEFENPGVSGCDVENSTIDRSGERGANSPEWKFVLNTNYEMPIASSYLLGFNALGYYSDGYLTDNTGFSKVWMYDTHGDLSGQVALSDTDKTWIISLYVKNYFHPREKYHPENDIAPTPVSTMNLNTSDFATYGIRLRYNFQ